MPPSSDLIKPILHDCGYVGSGRGNNNDRYLGNKIADLRILCEKVKTGVISNFGSTRSFFKILQNLGDDLELFNDQISLLEIIAPSYDSKVGIQANGYRSFLVIHSSILDKLTGFVVKLHEKNEQCFNKSFETDFRYWATYLVKLTKMNIFLLKLEKTMSNYGKQQQLFPDIPDLRVNPNLEDISNQIAQEDVSVFFGQGVGSHLKEEIQGFARMFLYIEALCVCIPSSPSESFIESICSQATHVYGLKNIFDSENLSKMIVSNSREQQLSFCKMLYDMSELPVVHTMMKIGTPSMLTRKLISIPPTPITMYDQDNNSHEVPVPKSHIGVQTLNVRFISSFRTRDMIGDWSDYAQSWWSGKKQSTPSRSIIFHAHGGAFVSQTSKSHESYLNYWANDTDIPILSVDYSLAPEAPYPRAVEEVFYAYAWMVNNFGLLGTTGENVIFVGDSAGANLLVGVTLQCISNQLQMPSSLFLCYPALLLKTFPSPSRLLSLLDPFGRFPYLVRCMNAYTNPEYMKSCPRTFEDELNASIEAPDQDPLISPLLASQEDLAKFPETNIFSSTMDQCLDESVTFSNKLKCCEVPVTLKVFEGLPHGFLSLNTASRECQLAVTFISNQLKKSNESISKKHKIQ